MAVVSLDGVVVWNTAAGGVSARLTPGVPRTLGRGPLPSVTLPALVETVADVGVGVWLKPGGVDFAQHRLELVWRVTSKAAVRGFILGIGGRFGDLVVPDEGTIARCALTGAGEISSFRADGAYVLQTTLTFTQYP